MDKIRFNCPKCSKKLAASSDKAGTKAKCPKCGCVVVIPQVASPRPGPVPRHGAEAGPSQAAARKSDNASAQGRPEPQAQVSRVSRQVPTNEEKKAIFDAVKAGNAVEVQRLLRVAPELITVRSDTIEWGDDDDIAPICTEGMTPLHWAAFYGFRRVAEVLVEAGAQVNVRDNNGKTPLHVLESKGHGEVEPLDDGPHLVGELLLTNGADIEARDKKGRTPLHSAVLSRLPMVVELLLSRGADPNARGEGRETPLHYAVLFSATIILVPEEMKSVELERAQRIVRMLVASGANVYAETAPGETPLLWAEGEVTKAQDAGDQEMLQCALETVEFLRQHRGGGQTPTNEQKKAIFKAVSDGDAVAVQRLLEATPELVNIRMDTIEEERGGR